MKKVKTRKPHYCDICEKIIPKSNEAYYLEAKTPKYDTKTADYNDNYLGKQIGIEYQKRYYHIDCIDNVESK